MSLWRDATFKREHTRLRFPGLRVVLTRFNLATRDTWGDAVRAPEAMAAWMAHRVPIFERTCLASMRALSEPPDLWLIGFDQAHEACSEAALASFADLPWAKPVWQQVGEDGVYESVIDVFARGVREEIGAHEYVMTTRLDNDDAIGVQYLAYARMYASAVLQHQKTLEDFWLSFPLGAVWGDDLRLWPYPANPFLSRIESAWRVHAPDFSAFGVRHNAVFEKIAPTFQAVTSQPMWLRVVHTQNVTGSGSANLLNLADAPSVLSQYFGLNADALSR